VKYIPHQVQLVSDNIVVFTKAINDGIEKIKALECYSRFSLNQRSSMEVFAMLHCLDYGIYNAFCQIYNAEQIFPERPNGGKWIAFGRTYTNDKGFPHTDNEGRKYSYAGERHAYLDDYMGAKSIEFHVYDLEGLGVKKYFNCPETHISDGDTLKLLRVIESGADTSGTGFNVELLKAIPWFAECNILRYDGGKPVLDIPSISLEEWRQIQEILRSARNQLSEDIIELLRVYLIDKRKQLPKHLTSVPLQKQYMNATGAMAMAVIRHEIHTKDERCPYPMIYVTEK
jgi:RNA polymerase sigma-70 factor (ECF subfamily)